MSAMAGNPHHSYADALSSESPHGDILEAKLAQAQVEATLALAYEQRTANLIAAMQPVNLPDGEALGLNIQKCAQIHAQIIERLGLS